MGGAAGHMAHPYDLTKRTFRDILEICKNVTENKCPLKEKLDGVNLMVKMVNGKLVAARNKATLQNPMSIEELTEKYKERPLHSKIFKQAMLDIQSFLKGYTRHLNAVNADAWINVEIIHPDMSNVIKYDKPRVVFLNWSTIFAVYEISRIPPTQMDVFEISSVNDIQIDNFPKQELSDLEAKFQSMSKNNLNMTIYEYIANELKSYIASNGIDRQYWDDLCKRWINGDKSKRLDKSNFDSVTLTKINLMNTDMTDTMNMAKLSLELAIISFSEILKKSANGLLNHSNNDYTEYVKKIQAKYSNNLSINRNAFKIFSSIPNDKILISSEGIVAHIDNTFLKFTGIFGPLNQLVGIEKYQK